MSEIYPHSIILAEFGAHPFRLAAIFDLIWFLHHLHGFAESVEGQHRYPYLAYFSLVAIVDSDLGTRAHCWYAQATILLSSIGIDIVISLPTISHWMLLLIYSPLGRC